MIEDINKQIEREVKSRVHRALEKLKPELVLPIAAEKPDNMDGEWRQFGGDASMANKEHFKVFFRKRAGETEIEIICPTFLRGPLNIHVAGEHIGASY